MTEETCETDYISLISKMSNHYGNYLIELMDEYNARNLQEISKEKAKAFYYKLLNRRKNQNDKQD